MVTPAIAADGWVDGPVGGLGAVTPCNFCREHRGIACELGLADDTGKPLINLVSAHFPFELQRIARYRCSR